MRPVVTVAGVDFGGVARYNKGTDWGGQEHFLCEKAQDFTRMGWGVQILPALFACGAGDEGGNERATYIPAWRLTH